MAFFDEIGRKITMTGQSAVRKTKDAAEVIKLNTQITEEINVRDQKYAEIGKLYMQLHADDFEEPFAALAEAVISSEMKIADMKDQINNLRGVKNCPKCGAQIPMSSPFCSVCGQQVESKAVPSGFGAERCSMCGAELIPGMAFCTNCGTGTGAAANNTTAPISPVIADNQESMPVMPGEFGVEHDQRTCPMCGNLQKADLAFCTVCGSPMEDMSGNMQQTQGKAEPTFTGGEADGFSSDGNTKVCPDCGNVQSSNFAFCTVCGSLMDSFKNDTETVPAQQNTINPAGGNAADNRNDFGLRRCPSCGNLQDKSLMFCSSCGIQLDNQEITVKPTVSTTVQPPKQTTVPTPVQPPKQTAVPTPVQLPKQTTVPTPVQLPKQTTVPAPVQPPKQTTVPAPVQPIVPTPVQADIPPNTEMRRCPSCGNVQILDYVFCTNCGSITDVVRGGAPEQPSGPISLSKPADNTDKKNAPVSKVRRCPDCGNIQEKDIVFCTKCGYVTELVNADEVPSQEAAIKPEPPVPAPAVQPDAGGQQMNHANMQQIKPQLDPDKKRCPKCGNVQTVNFPFCTECGTDMSSAPQAELGSSLPNAAAPMNAAPAAQNNVMPAASSEDTASMMPNPDAGVPAVTPLLVRKLDNETFRITGATCKIGRDKGTNDYVVKNNKYIGHNHCHIINRKGEYFIIDDNSKNHTYVNGVMLVPNTGVKLSDGQIIKLANEEFEFKIL